MTDRKNSNGGDSSQGPAPRPDQRSRDAVLLPVGDLTARKPAEGSLKVEEATRQTARQLQEVIEGSPGHIFIKDLDGRYLMVNRSYEQSFGVSREGVEGKTDYEIFSTQQADVFRANDRSVAETGTALQAEEPFGTQLFLSNRFPLRDASGAIYAVCGIATDITKRKHSEERWREMQKLESLGLLAGGVAHRFNNLLTGVLGSADLIQEMLDSNHPASELAKGILQTGQQLAHLTSQILASAGKGRFVLESLDLSKMVYGMRELLHASIPKTAALHLDLEQDLPVMKADRNQTKQIVLNLVVNAGEAIGDGTGEITVRTRSREVDDRYLRTNPDATGLSPGEYVVLQVCDTGCGMDTEVKAKIFEPFFTTKFLGRGLGLAAVAGIVRGHQGAVIVSSHPGKGSAFEVALPVTARPGRAQPAPAPAATNKSLGLVLVIDDEPIVRQAARLALERKGYSVLEADDGLAALDIFRRYRAKIDLAILDLTMPGMSGEETLDELRKIRPEVKVLLSSGYIEDASMTVFQGQHISGFLQKPYTAATLAETVKCALS
jgi:two-component system cell cycle sensor histidine kinase/response regulator CckA